MPTTPSQPGDGFLGWLGRQIGYVSRAVKTDVTTPLAPAAPLVIHREISVTQQPMPDQPQIMLRRTTIDEAILAPDQYSTDGNDAPLGSS